MYEPNLFPRLFQGWKWVRLGDISDILGGVTKGRKLNGKTTVRLPYLRVANVQDGFFFFFFMKNIDIPKEEKFRYLLKFGDVLYTEGGDKDKLGRGTIWRNQIPRCIFQNHIFRARLPQKYVLPKFIAYYSQSVFAKNYFYQNAKQTVNLASINMTILSNLPIPLVDLDIQKRAVAEIEQRLSVADNLEKNLETSLQEVEALRQSILKKAFEGKLTENWRKKHPELVTGENSAERLLERIKEEKEKVQS